MNWTAVYRDQGALDVALEVGGTPGCWGSPSELALVSTSFQSGGTSTKIWPESSVICTKSS